MQQAINFVWTLIVGLFALIMGAIATVEVFLRGLLGRAGVDGQLQSVIMIAAAVLLILAALRLFGGIFGVLITLFLILMVVHIMMPGVQVPATTHI
jgi:hypothetical protein